MERSKTLILVEQMQRMGGGGNDPSCGCDMQAGWPSDLPRGGVQGGGANVNSINSFNLALTNKTGKTTHFRGQRNANDNAKNTGNNNLNTNTINNSNLNTNYNTNKNNNKRTVKQTIKKRKTNNKSQKRTTSAPEELNKVVYKGNRYYTEKNTGNTYKRSANGNVGNYVGKLLENNNGKKVLNTTVPESKPLTSIQSPPMMDEMVNNIDIETEGANEMNQDTRTPLTQDGGGSSFETTLQNLKMAGGGMPACGSCPFPGTGYCDFYAKGGGCGCSAGLFKGGYRPTKKNLKALKKWKRGESIGFTMTSSLKAKGLIPRTSRTMKGKKVISKKYR